MEITIITGLSGAGKSIAANALEDIGFYCIDNMPPSLIPTFAELAKQLPKIEKVAFVTDVRAGDFWEGLFDCFAALKEAGIEYKILFLDANDETLALRYSETRRKHPLVTNNDTSTINAIRDERVLLSPVRELADYYIDTSLLSSAQLGERVLSLFLEDGDDSLHITCMSFGFKYGVPAESDLVFDVRCLPNPFYIKELKDQTGLDADVREYVMRSDDTGPLLKKLKDLVGFLLPLYKKEGKSQLVVSIGCTGGRHRSVALTEAMNKHIKEIGYYSKPVHRDIDRNKK